MYPYVVCHCGRDLGSIYYFYKEIEKNYTGDEAKGEILDLLGLIRNCCRSKMLCTVEFVDVYRQKKKL